MLDTLRAWLWSRLDDANRQWLHGHLLRMSAPFKDMELYIPFGMMTRKLGNADLLLAPQELTQAEAIKADWQPGGWSLADTGRLLLLLSAARNDRLPITKRLQDLTTHADVGELISLYRGLPLYPQPEQLVDIAAEGVRSNMQAVFNAVALDNPYPYRHFDRRQWNQMVLKALFVGSPLFRIVGLDERTNDELALMLQHYYHERKAAGRQVSPELWRCMGPQANVEMLGDLRETLQHEQPLQRQAAALALSACSLPQAAALLQGQPEANAISEGVLSWHTLVAAMQQGN